MTQCARQLTDDGDGFLLGKRYLLHDRDEKFIHGFDRMLRTRGGNRSSLTARRFPTGQPASGSDACKGVSPRVTPSDSSPPMVLLPNTSARGYRREMAQRFQIWPEVTGMAIAA